MNQEILDLFKSGAHEKAIIALTKLLDQDPNNVSLLLQLAMMLIEVTDLTQARQVLQRAAAIAPKQPEILYNQAVVMHQLKQDDQAIAVLQQLGQTKLAADANYLMAVIYFEQNKNQLATAFALTAVEQSPDELGTNLLLAQILAKQQAWAQSLSYAKKAYDLQSDNADAAFVYGAALLNHHEEIRGKQLLEQARQLAPKKYESAVQLILTE